MEEESKRGHQAVGDHLLRKTLSTLKVPLTRYSSLGNETKVIEMIYRGRLGSVL